MQAAAFRASRCARSPTAPGSPTRRRPLAAGFTIVEVMMGVFIMAFSIATSITTMQRGFMSIDSARNISLASQIMQSEIEKMRLKDWSVVSGYAPDPATPTTTEPGIDPAFASVSSRFRLVRTTSTPTGQTDVRKIVLTVTWTGADGRTMSRSYTTYYGRYGLWDYYYNSV